MTTFGASAVPGFPSGSSSHWNPWWMRAVVAEPWSSKILTAIHCASGRHADRASARVAADHHAHRRGSVPVHVRGCRRVLPGRDRTSCSIRRASAPRDPGGRGRRPCPCWRRRSPAAEAEVPQRGRVDERDVGLRCSRARLDAGPATARSAVTRSTSSRASSSRTTVAVARDREPVEDPERRDVRHLAAGLPRGEEAGDRPLAGRGLRLEGRDEGPQARLPACRRERGQVDLVPQRDDHAGHLARFELLELLLESRRDRAVGPPTWASAPGRAVEQASRTAMRASLGTRRPPDMPLTPPARPSG